MAAIAELAQGCPTCSGSVRRFTFSTGETITLCPGCGRQRGHDVLQKGFVPVYRSEYWQSVLLRERLGVLSSAEIGTLRIGHTAVVVYRRDEETGQQHTYGSSVGMGFLAPTKRTPSKQPCRHLALASQEWKALRALGCPDCHAGYPFFPNQVFSTRAAAIIRSNGQLWKDRRHTRVRLDQDSYGKDDFRSFTPLNSGFVDLWFPRRAPRRVLTLDGDTAPEIDQRRREAAFRYELQNPPYRAPHRKVLEMRDAGLPIDRIARRLKVSASTIDNRLWDIPETVPCPDRLVLRVKAGGGYSRPERPAEQERHASLRDSLDHWEE